MRVFSSLSRFGCCIDSESGKELRRRRGDETRGIYEQRTGDQAEEERPRISEKRTKREDVLESSPRVSPFNECLV